MVTFFGAEWDELKRMESEITRLKDSLELADKTADRLVNEIELLQTGLREIVAFNEKSVQAQIAKRILNEQKVTED